MKTILKSAALALAVAAAPLFAPAAQAQLGVTVNPYMARQARMARTGISRNGVVLPLVRASRLKYMGPMYRNPRRPATVVVLRRGSTVPAFVPTTLVENRNVPGLMPRADYRYFITQARRTVFLTPETRTVVKIMR